MIDRTTVDKIYAAANIVEIIGDYVTLKRKGVNYMACCPFHNEKTPSFVVSPSKGLYKCFGCGKGGNAVTFLMEHESVSYPEALKMVAKRYNIPVEEREESEEDIRRNNDRESMFAVNSWAAEYFMNYLHNESEGRSVGLSYFRQQRRLTDATIRKFGLGFCPSYGDRMTTDALKAGYKEEYLKMTGLTKARESDGHLYDPFRDRVIFPVHNISGRVVAFGARTLRSDKKVAKYLNSPESEIYSKRNEIYGLYFAKRAIQQQDCAIMVEGYLDVISMHQVGIENVVASSGTSLTQQQIRLLSRFSRNMTVIYDSDPAGIKASLRGIDLILQEGLNVRVVLLPDGEDPDSFARSHTADEVRQYIADHEQDFLNFKARLLLDEAKGDPARKAMVIGDMVQSIAQIPDAIQRAVYIKECARTTDTQEQVLIAEVARKRLSSSGDRETDEFMRRQSAQIRDEQAETERAEAINVRVEPGSSVETLESALVQFLLQHGHCNFEVKEGHHMVDCNVAEFIFTELETDKIRFENPLYEKIVSLYRSIYEEQGVGVKVPEDRFIQYNDPDVVNRVVEILMADKNYTMSKIWKRNDIHVESEEEMLAAGVPKTIHIFKSKVIDRMIRQQHDILRKEDLSEEEQSQAVKTLAHLNTVKVKLAKKIERLIL
ncbi:MAG: DNA primase [Alistipes sp.]|nr:DNA primase [Alistipes sp.]MBQ8652784.1 DNA primase [Alistipes sp.]MBR4052890.1 DNA primase [Alistipes sp.]